MSDTAMTNTEIAAMFSNEFSEMKSSAARQRLPILPEVRLAVQMTKRDVPIGTWFLVDANVPKGEEKKVEILGDRIRFTVLRDSMRLACFSEADKKYLIETTEFQDYTRDPVFLLDNRSGRLKITALCPYSGPQEETISNLRKEISPTLPPKSNFGFEYFVYVLMEDGRIAVLRNTKRGHFGTDLKTGDSLKFATISEDSFMRARANCHKVTPGITCAHQWEAYATHIQESGKDVRPAFAIGGFIAHDTIPKVKESGLWLKSYLHARYAGILGYAWSNMDQGERLGITTAYSNVAALLNESGGEHEAAAMIFGKRSNLTLADASDKDLQTAEMRNKHETERKIKELQNEQGAPTEEPEPLVPAVQYQHSIDPSDLPF